MRIYNVGLSSPSDWVWGRKRGRVVEGTSLLRMHTAYTCIEGSNPSASAKYYAIEVNAIFALTFFVFLAVLAQTREAAFIHKE